MPALLLLLQTRKQGVAINPFFKGQIACLYTLLHTAFKLCALGSWEGEVGGEKGGEGGREGGREGEGMSASVSLWKLHCSIGCRVSKSLLISFSRL